MRHFGLHRLLVLATTIIVVFVAPLLSAATHEASASASASPEREIAAIMDAWIDAVADKQTGDLTMFLDSESEAYYLNIQEMALNAGPAELMKVTEVDQLQIMFFRLMMDRDRLQESNATQLLAFAVEKGFIGMELRSADLLKEVKVSGDTAEGRLYKFGLDDRPDRYQQYFVKELDVWRVSLRGERERLAGEFDSFVERAGLSRSEAAFFILEMRIMRKVTASDFFESRDLVVAKGAAPVVHSGEAVEQFRLVSVRLPETLFGKPAVTLDDSLTGLKTVVQLGESLPGYPGITLQRTEPNTAVFEDRANPSMQFTLSLDAKDHLSRRGAVGKDRLQVHKTLLDEAILGDQYAGEMMVQWRNIGLRGRPQLLQQAWLTPDFGGALGADKRMLGLKVSRITPSSFWNQIGLEEGDLLKEVNGISVDTLDAWKEVIQIAQTKQELHVTLERGDLELIFRTSTVRPG